MDTNFLNQILIWLFTLLWTLITWIISIILYKMNLNNLKEDRKNYFRKELHFNLKNKTFELLMLIDKMEDKSVFLNEDLWIKENIEKIKTYRETKNHIINLIKIYLYDFNLEEYIIRNNNIEKILLLLYQRILNVWEYNDEIFKNLDNIQKENQDFINNLKNDISNYLINNENLLLNRM